MYAIEFTRSAQKELLKLSTEMIRRIVPKIDALSLEPFPSGCVKIVGAEDLWRIRIGDYRVIYSVQQTIQLITIERIRHRKDAYRS